MPTRPRSTNAPTRPRTTTVAITEVIDPPFEGLTLKTVSPYHPSLPSAFKSIGGRWSDDKKAWYFEKAQLDRVRSICLTIFGVDPIKPAPEDLVKLRFELDSITNEIPKALWRWGRALVTRRSFDQPVTLGRGVVVEAGGFEEIAGGPTTPRVGYPAPGTVLIVNNVPRALASTELHNATSGVTVLESDNDRLDLAVKTQVMELVRQISWQQRQDLGKAILAMEDVNNPPTIGEMVKAES